MTIAQLTNEALALPLQERAALAQQLWDSIYDEGTVTGFIDNTARAEIERRDAEMESGSVPGVPHDEAMAKIEKSLRCT
jgi:putative addiction module component (TIGR02574 family)